MNILICCDAFKTCLSSESVAACIKSAVTAVDPSIECRIFPMADGGEGTLEVLSQHMPIAKVELEVHDPLFRKIPAYYYRFQDSAFIELSNASGFALLQHEERNPMHTTSLGTGEQILHALENGAGKIYLFLGGSATNDAGIGIAHALGFRFWNQEGVSILPVGSQLLNLRRIVPPQYDYRNIEFTVLSDVKNLLHGPNGAAFTYAPQKGAGEKEVEILDRGLRNFAELIFNSTGKDIAKIVGGGAAGGVAAGMAGLFDAKIKGGFDCIAQITGIEKMILETDLVISGEGQLDHQSLQGKLVSGIAAICAKHKKKLMLIVGNNALESKIWKSLGITSVYAVRDLANNNEDAIRNAPQYIGQLATNLILDNGDALR